MTETLPSILIVDDDDLVACHLKMVLESQGWSRVITCLDSRDVMKVLREKEISLVLLDLVMPFVSGEELLIRIKEEFPDLQVIITSCLNEVDTAVRCLQYHAYDYLVKPIDENRLAKSIQRALELYELKSQVDILKQRILNDKLTNPVNFAAIITRNKAMSSIFQYIEAIAPTSQPVLITGETGVGKELIAEAIHKASGRKGNCVTLNIAGLDETVFSDTLFGHQPGAYTGAAGVREGLVKKAAQGTLFLDEIGDLGAELQVKLLRLIQEREYYALGSDTPRRSEARIIVATNKNLKEMAENKLFRSDLYFRLVSHQIHIPPLRDRREDLPLLVDFYVEQIANEMAKAKPAVPAELFQLFHSYSFPGNIRELKSLLYDAVANHKGRFLNLDRIRDYLKIDLLTLVKDEPVEDYQIAETVVGEIPTLKQMTLQLIKEALQRTGGNQSAAADLLGITRQTLARYINGTSKAAE